MEPRPGLLYLDDEENNLFSFQALFRRDYTIFTTSSPAEAVNYLREHDVHVILSDQKMGEISGVEFFELVRNEFPDPVRVLVTGYADIEAVIDAINKGQVYRYITKPWNEQELRICIQDAYDKFMRERELRDKNAELERTNAELDKFIYSTSHDLRAPLVSAMGVMSLLKQESDPARYPEYLSMLDASLMRLNEAVQNIIYYYQNAKTGELIELIDLAGFVDEIVAQCRTAYVGPAPDFRIELSCAGPFRSDRHRLKVILLNIVGNAIRYADRSKAEPWISIRVVQNAERAVIRVEDNGTGIDPARLDRLFEPYDGVGQRSVTSGVGLFISKQAANKIGASIRVSSVPGEGSTFTLEVPNKR